MKRQTKQTLEGLGFYGFIVKTGWNMKCVSNYYTGDYPNNEPFSSMNEAIENVKKKYEPYETYYPYKRMVCRSFVVIRIKKSKIKRYGDASYNWGYFYAEGKKKIVYRRRSDLTEVYY